MHRSGLAAAGLCMLLAPAHAAEFTRRGAAIHLTGAIKPGDEFKLRDFLARPGGAKPAVIYLASPGGFISPAQEMARIIRKAGLATAVDARTSFCSSACTALFVAGVARHYVNAQGIRDGDKGSHGLGFHESNVIGVSGRVQYSGAGTAFMIDIYYEMGVPGAAKLVTRSPYTGLFAISAATALELGIATSLSAP